MRLKWLGGLAAVGLLATMGSASAAPIITLAISPLCNLGTVASPGNTFVTSTLPANPCGSSQPEISSITFSGGSSTGTSPLGDPGHPSGVYAGSRVGSYTSPFLTGSPLSNPTIADGASNSTLNYLAAQPGGSVTVTYSTQQSSLAILWGTVDPGVTMNLLSATGGTLTTITGQDVCNAVLTVATCNGSRNVEVDIAGTFMAYMVTDTNNPSAFEFVPGTQVTTMIPEPASLTLLGIALAGFGIWRRRKAA